MTSSTKPALQSSATAVRWAARLLSVPLLLFVGYFVAANLIGLHGLPSWPINVKEGIVVTALVASLLGLAVAWKWELIGGALALGGVLAFGLLSNPAVLLAFPVPLMLVNALLFFGCGWLTRTARPAASSPDNGS